MLGDRASEKEPEMSVIVNGLVLFSCCWAGYPTRCRQKDESDSSLSHILPPSPVFSPGTDLQIHFLDQCAPLNLSLLYCSDGGQRGSALSLSAVEGHSPKSLATYDVLDLGLSNLQT